MSYLLDAEHARFVQSGVSITLSSRNEAMRSSVGKGIACRVSEDRRTVTVFLMRKRAAPVLVDLEAGFPVAAVFCLPSTHRTIQLKAGAASVAPMDAAQAPEAMRQKEALALDLATFGYTPSFVRAYFSYEADDMVAVTFSPEAAFMQTPGPRAGTPMPAVA